MKNIQNFHISPSDKSSDNVRHRPDIKIGIRLSGQCHHREILIGGHSKACIIRLGEHLKRTSIGVDAQLDMTVHNTERDGLIAKTRLQLLAVDHQCKSEPR